MPPPVCLAQIIFWKFPVIDKLLLEERKYLSARNKKLLQRLILKNGSPAGEVPGMVGGIQH